MHGTYAQEQIVVQSHVQPETNNEIRVVQRAAQFASSSCVQRCLERAHQAESMFALRRSTTRCVALLQVAAEAEMYAWKSSGGLL